MLLREVLPGTRARNKEKPGDFRIVGGKTVPMDFDAILIGAGPFGLSAAAYLKNKGLGVAIFGEPMSFWNQHMPAGMFLRSNWQASFIADPHNRLTLDHFMADTGARFSQPVPLEDFVSYGKWFQQKAVPELRSLEVTRVEKLGNEFNVTLESGEQVRSRRVIVATGIAPFPWRPGEFCNLPASHVTHSSDHTDLSRFRGQQVLVVGGGQSALDAARILTGFGASAEVVAKQEVIHWVGLNGWLHRLGPISRILTRPTMWARPGSAAWSVFRISSGSCHAERKTASASGRPDPLAQGGNDLIS